MNYNEYIETQCVMDFIEYFNKNKLEIGKSHWIAKEGQQFEANSLEEACSNYIWTSRFLSPNNSYGLFTNSTTIQCSDWNSTQAALKNLSEGLKQSLAEGSDEETLDWCRCILDWGMGPRGDATLTKLKNLAEAQQLNSYLNNISATLALDALSIDQVTDFLLTMPNNDKPWMSSGLSKIISLSTDNIIIMDSRVGAALCELINKFLGENNNEFTIPEELLLAWSPASGSINRRQPRMRINQNNNHPQFRYDTSWLKQQIKASWLLRGTLKKSKNISNSIHKLEAGLFMIGYNLDNTTQESYQERVAELKINNKVNKKETSNPIKPNKPTKKEIAIEIVNKNTDKSRAQVIELLIREGKLTKSGASTYYQNCKSIWR